MYDRIVDESVFIARASEGAISTEWVMSQPVSTRERYVKMFTEELQERKRKIEQNDVTG